MDADQMSLFPDDDFTAGGQEWWGMPGYVSVDGRAVSSVRVQFATVEDRKAFSDMVGAKITDRTKGIWFPVRENRRLIDFRYADES